MFKTLLCVKQHDFKCMYDMKVHIVSYNLDQKNFSKSKIHILPNYEQTDLKTAIVAKVGYLIISVTSEKSSLSTNWPKL